MPNIIDISYFQAKNELRIPMAEDIPNTDFGASSDSNVDAINELIAEVEMDVMIGAFGFTNYDLLKTALVDLDNADQKWKDLVNGVLINGKKWNGLRDKKSLLAFAVKSVWLVRLNPKLTELGTSLIKSKDTFIVSPNKNIADLFNTFVNKYQFGDDNYLSLYDFLVERSSDFDFDSAKFTFFEHQNSFNL